MKLMMTICFGIAPRKKTNKAWHYAAEQFICSAAIAGGTMKLSEGYITQPYKDELLLVAAGPAAAKFRGLARANETAAFLIERLGSETDEAGLVAALRAEYDVDEETARADVRDVLDKLRSIGALDE